jgi:hypothetical protein
MSISCECCVLLGRDLLRQADHSSRGVLLSMVRRCLATITGPWTALGRSTTDKTKNMYSSIAFQPCHQEEVFGQLHGPSATTVHWSNLRLAIE